MKNFQISVRLQCERYFIVEWRSQKMPIDNSTEKSQICTILDEEHQIFILAN